MYGESYKSEIRTLSTAARRSILSIVGEYVSLAILLIVDFEIPVKAASCRADMFLLYIKSASNIFIQILFAILYFLFATEICLIIFVLPRRRKSLKREKKLLSLILAMIMVLSLFTMPVQAATKKVTNQTKSIVMVVKQKSTIKPPVKMTYKSSNSKIATVNSKGVIVAKAKGSAIVTGKYRSIKWTCKIKVEAPRLNTSSLKMNIQSSRQLKITGTTRKISWSSSAPRIAAVSSSGKVTALKSGSAVITAKINGIKYPCKIVVTKNRNPAVYVWICDTGKKYHSNKECSKMNYPYQVTIKEAKARGYDACKKCYR